MYIKQLLFLGLLFINLPAPAQQERKDIREGNKLFRSDKFNESEVAYRKAIDLQSNSVPGSFNLGDALYRQEKFEDAGIQFNQVVDNNVNKNTKSQAFHNLGNSLLQTGELDDAIEAYKNSLRNVPGDMETKYNLAYAQNMKKQQEEQEKKENKDQNKDQQDQNKDKQDQNKDEQDQNKDQQDQNKDQQDQQDQQDQKNEQQQQPQEGKISKEDAQRLLEALANDEKKVQEKVKKDKAKAQRVRVLKDW